MNKVDAIEDKEMLELVEMEMRELLTTYGFDGDNTPIILGSALCALESRRPELGETKIDELLTAVDEWIPTPDRDIEKPFLMSVEDVFSIPGRGTVASGRVERGVLKRDSEVELVGKNSVPIKTKVTDIETFKKSCEESRAGDNSGLLLRGVKREDVKRGMIIAKPGTVKAHAKFLASMYVLTKDEGGRHTGFHNNYRPQVYLRTAGKNALPFALDIITADHSPQTRQQQSTGPRAVMASRRTAWSCQATTSRWSVYSTTLSLSRRASASTSARAVALSPPVSSPD